MSMIRCTVCSYETDVKGGVAALPDDFVCPMCGVGKDKFEDE
jgi:rubredoxin